jgi:hypothetical protein
LLHGGRQLTPFRYGMFAHNYDYPYLTL